MSASDRRPAATAAVPPQLGSPQEFVLLRSGDRDLKFTGWRLGQSTGGWDELTEVEIYASAAGRLITRVVSYRLALPLPKDFAEAQRLASKWDARRHVQIDGQSWLLIRGLPERQEAEARGAKLERIQERAATAMHESGEAALAWLKKTNDGALGTLGKAAWTEACLSWPALTEMLYETVE
jgi:hypothetical protein